VPWREKKVDSFYVSPEWRTVRLAVLKRDRFKCVLCGERATTVDHIVRRREGGTESPANLRSLCTDCDHKLKEKWDGSRGG
jgi:5-methylcytosine-specific restriction endonuclease McrA